MHDRFSRRAALVILLLTTVLFSGVATSGTLAAQSGTLGATDPTGSPLSGEAHHLDPSSLDLLNIWSAQNSSFQSLSPGDQRTQITDTTTFPSSAIADVFTTSSSTLTILHCTGAIIAPQVMLIAAHCLYDQSLHGWATSIQVYPGQSQETRPFGMVGGTDSWVTDAWIKSPQSETDWGIVKLLEPIGNQTGWFQLGVFSTAGLVDPHFQPALQGYDSSDTQWHEQEESFLNIDDTTLYSHLDADDDEIGWLSGERAIA